MESIRVDKVEKNFERAEELLDFVRGCSWVEVRDHLASMIEHWVFTDWETMFMATIRGKIVGICTIMKTDYYPLPEIFPWISSVYVLEEYRGKRVSEKLIGFANGYAVAIGFGRTYIPTEYIGLYEKYDIVFFGRLKIMEGEKNVYWLRNLTKQTSIFSWQFTEGRCTYQAQKVVSKL